MSKKDEDRTDYLCSYNYAYMSYTNYTFIYEHIQYICMRKYLLICMSHTYIHINIYVCSNALVCILLY